MPIVQMDCSDGYAGRIALEAIQRFPPSHSSAISEETGDWSDLIIKSWGVATDCSELALAGAILVRWHGRRPDEAARSIEAGCDLLTRLTSRRYYKQVFRNLPNEHNKQVDKKSADLAEHFKDPTVRFRVERSIESHAHLEPGTVVIHCPKFNTAQKIANVLLALPDDDNVTDVRKLRHIGELDPGLFTAHQVAIGAVEEMYRSMWRLYRCA